MLLSPNYTSIHSFLGVYLLIRFFVSSVIENNTIDTGLTDFDRSDFFKSIQIVVIVLVYV